MANIYPNTEVTLTPRWMNQLRFRPPTVNLVIVVHPMALRATANLLTLTAHFTNEQVTWVGALDEKMLSGDQTSPITNGRERVSARLLTGAKLWHILTPGHLFTTLPIEETVVYAGSRPWLIVGELDNGHFLALPLNDAAGYTNKRYTLKIAA